MKFQVTSFVACSFLFACLTFAQESGEAITVSTSTTTSSSTLTVEEAKLAEVQKDFKMLQGDWEKNWGGGNHSGLDEDSPLVYHFLKATTLADKLKIRQNHVSADSCYRSERATIAIDFSGFDVKPLAEKNLNNGKLIMFVLPSGKPFLASYDVDEEGLTLRYPAGCCSRSGWVANFARVTPANPEK